ncbi:hypothetical protein FN846DRAFT_624784 [Sphaerosporella brunnea]|uniref:Uncharacterized protein n=1 Tax=Sphaerosporella brunnea TaxID=1250544 RepID=A0A5J5F0E8_9PEZI|nr:hypothetical protein FN846DRAFT_624784 [Sphaerosporella brunnea]
MTANRVFFGTISTLGDAAFCSQQSWSRQKKKKRSLYQQHPAHAITHSRLRRRAIISSRSPTYPATESTHKTSLNTSPASATAPSKSSVLNTPKVAAGWGSAGRRRRRRRCRRSSAKLWRSRSSSPASSSSDSVVAVVVVVMVVVVVVLLLLLNAGEPGGRGASICVRRH